MGNSSLSQAKRNKKDEFYTQISDIEDELRHYRDHFKGKTIFMNADDPEESNFWKYFYLNFEFLGLKKIISTHYKLYESTYKLEYDGKEVVKTRLKGNGDFRSPEALEILKESDVVVTNPPFSMFREFIGQLVEYEKDFLIMGNNNAVTYKEVFPLIKDKKVWLGYNANKTMEFRLPDDYEKWDRIDEEGNKYGKVPAISWYTNLNHSKRNEEIILFKEYNEEDYPTYDNFDAIEVGRVANIPVDYEGVMGVPITFLTRHNPEQFDIVGLGTSREHYTPNKKYEGLKTISKKGKVSGGAPINSTLAIRVESKPENRKYYADKEGNYYMQPYARILIKKK